MGHTVIQIQSYLFIISLPKVSFPFKSSQVSIFKESFLHGIYFSLHTIIFIQSHILRLQMGSTTFKVLKPQQILWLAAITTWAMVCPHLLHAVANNFVV